MRLIDADALDDLICQLNEEGHEITRNEYKMIDNILFEFPTVCDIEQIRAEIEQIEGVKYEVSDNQGKRYKYETIEKSEALQIIDKYTK